jgi:hypothetical protein
MHLTKFIYVSPVFKLCSKKPKGEGKGDISVALKLYSEKPEGEGKGDISVALNLLENAHF